MVLLESLSVIFNATNVRYLLQIKVIQYYGNNVLFSHINSGFYYEFNQQDPLLRKNRKYYS